MASLILLQILGIVSLSTSQAILARQSQGQPLNDIYPMQNFTMPIDHFHNETRYAPHTNDTFVQNYWLDTSNYVEGGPVIIHAMGEDSTFDLDWLQSGLVHQVANATGGVAVLWGQRYYSGGAIIPYGQYNTSNLRFHSTEQALADLAYFAQKAVFAGLEHKNLTAPGTPWIIIGGSYAGVISAFTRIQYPDLFWGGLSSSGITTAIDDAWSYYDVIRRYGPKACISNQQQLVALMDNVYSSGNKTALSQLISAFNLSESTPYSDFASYVDTPLQEWDLSWASQNTPINGSGSYCNYLTNQTDVANASATLKATARSLLRYANKTATPDANDLYYPLLNFAGYMLNTYSFCDGQTVEECLSLYTPTPFTWLICTEYGQFATGYTPGSPGHPAALPLVSRTLTPEYFLAQCKKTYNITYGPQLQRFNKYGGVNLSYPRLAISTGQFDFYRPFGPLAEFLPNTTAKPNPRIASNGTIAAPQIVIEGAYHEWDFYGFLPNQTTMFKTPVAVQSAKSREIEAVKTWLQEWNQTHT
ncbi:serine carboxypeptidase S28-domain-containing protein [Exophiala viscosa]|uniref:serine carboxypeptidase S28-domain-containing protein n=1 Tax=Exophiala viscosa TaxID=2486360 RepID=UPI00219C1689|nr:serine carboxypeptidase S28-domain-containing protein [Exophiala viscosa]